MPSLEHTSHKNTGVAFRHMVENVRRGCITSYYIYTVKNQYRSEFGCCDLGPTPIVQTRTSTYQEKAGLLRLPLVMGNYTGLGGQVLKLGPVVAHAYCIAAWMFFLAFLS